MQRVEGIIYTPFNYNYTYNLKYMKICAGTKSSSLLPNKPPSCTTWAPMTFTGSHYKLDLWAYAQ